MNQSKRKGKRRPCFPSSCWVCLPLSFAAAFPLGTMTRGVYDTAHDKVRQSVLIDGCTMMSRKLYVRFLFLSVSSLRLFKFAEKCTPICSREKPRTMTHTYVLHLEGNSKFAIASSGRDRQEARSTQPQQHYSRLAASAKVVTRNKIPQRRARPGVSLRTAMKQV
jgi:hypothetical protein